MEYGIVANPSTFVNQTLNAILEQIHQVIGNIVWTYNIKETHIHEDDPWMGILVVTAFEICSTVNILKGYSPVQLVFCRDAILLIKHKMDWELICQLKQAQINKCSISKNSKRVDHNYRVGDKFILDKNSAFKFETPYKGPFEIKKCCTNGTVTLQRVTTKLDIIYAALRHVCTIKTMRIIIFKTNY